ncbi:MAG: NADH-quinone oxidoreductase subunit H [Candidatus Omnitrophica bacterium]|nr:NADH-quinone oxidoreductase subunit H [Candidatus Omnitrophota bacterium]MBU1869328.1 NADH-quinone oxidoreductase subunit H [Candidatus Omnitrophota bacterium]
MKALFDYLIFPGFLFSAVIGLLAGWVDRKVTARLQWRVGPPWYQNFMDIIKLFCKETIVPEGAKLTFLFSPFFGLLSLALVATILGRSIIAPAYGFIGDLIVVLYLLMIPAIALIIGASSSKNPLASVGASREMKLVLAYELPFILSIIVVIIKSQGVIRLGGIVEHQMAFGSNIASISGVIAFLVALICVQAKLGFVPFDASESEQEIMGGVLIEYSGLPLAIFKLTKAIMLYTAPLLLMTLFLGKDLSPVFAVAKYIGILVVIILIKNTNPRLRIDQSVRFFWRFPAVLSLVAVVLALFGK